MLHERTFAKPEPLSPDRSRDYDLIRRAIAFLSESWAEQPSLDRLAEHLGLSPPHIEYKRGHLYDINPVGVGSMALATTLAIAAFSGLFGPTLRALSSFVAFLAAFASAPAIATCRICTAG